MLIYGTQADDHPPLNHRWSLCQREESSGRSFLGGSGSDVTFSRRSLTRISHRHTTTTGTRGLASAVLPCAWGGGPDGSDCPYSLASVLHKHTDRQCWTHETSQCPLGITDSGWQGWEPGLRSPSPCHSSPDSEASSLGSLRTLRTVLESDFC